MKPSIGQIITTVCEYFNADHFKVVNGERGKTVWVARNVCFLLIQRYYPQFSNRRIASLFGVDHSAVSRGVRTAETYKDIISHVHYILKTFVNAPPTKSTPIHSEPWGSCSFGACAGHGQNTYNYPHSLAPVSGHLQKG